MKSINTSLFLFTGLFRVGLFGNPYLDPGNTLEIVGNPEYMKAGFDFAYGLNWSGVINDKRVEKYS